MSSVIMVTKLALRPSQKAPMYEFIGKLLLWNIAVLKSSQQFQRLEASLISNLKFSLVIYTMLVIVCWQKVTFVACDK